MIDNTGKRVGQEYSGNPKSKDLFRGYDDNRRENLENKDSRNNRENFERKDIEKNDRSYDSQRREDFNKAGTREYRTNLQNTGVGGMVIDFIIMLAPQNTQEMICFALHSLENFVSEAVDVGMQDPDLFLKCFNLIDLTVPANFINIQYDMIKTLASRLIQSRAEELIPKNGITRLLKAYTSQPEKLQSVILELFEQTLKLGRRSLEIPALISICLCPYPSINVLGMKTLEILSEPADPGNRSMPQIVDAQFENHIRFFITACTNEKQTEEYRNSAAACVANLSLREYLRSQIIYCGGVDTLLYMVKDSTKIQGQRMAAKALVNLTATKRDLKMKVVAELSDEIKKLYRNELDGIVSAYLQTLVSSR